jgi:hypothetical protein
MNAISPNTTKFMQLNINLMQALKEGNSLMTMVSNIVSDVLLEGSEINTGRLNMVYIYACVVKLSCKAQYKEFNLNAAKKRCEIGKVK